MGASMEVAKYTERLVPSTRIVSVDGIAPTLSGANNFIAPSASIVGNVTMGDHSR
jgi:carbonic anhydrase/acetyltransferase-like protein (isoleucine patch superfamily)